MHKHFTINLTDSVPRGIYLLQEPKNLKKGDYIVFPIPENAKEYIYGRNYLPENVKNLIKKLGADEQDQISINSNGIYINNNFYGAINSKDTKGLPLPILSIKEMQPLRGEVLPLADNNYSFDGRYFGKIKKKDILYKAKLLIPF